MYYITQIEAMQRLPRVQIFTKKSLTVPDMADSLEKILKRFVAGEELFLSHPVHYDENPTFETYDNSRSEDLVDLHAALAAGRLDFDEADDEAAGKEQASSVADSQPTDQPLESQENPTET